MKKISILLSFLILAGFSAKGFAQADTSMFLNITVANSGVSVVSHFSNIGFAVGLGTFTISSSNVKGTIENTGTSTVDLALKCTNVNGIWIPSAANNTNTAVNQFVLQGVFCTYNTNLTHSSFGPEDVITANNIACDGAAPYKYGIAGGPDYRRGFGMDALQIVNMRFRFKPAANAVVGDSKAITVKVHASVH
jgi:hypothetical protein